MSRFFVTFDPDQVTHQTRLMVQQKLAEVCGDVLYCDVSDMETVCGQVLENNGLQRPKRHAANKRHIVVNFKMIGGGNQSMDWIGQKLRQSGQQMAEDYTVSTGSSGKHLRVSKLVHFALKCHKSFVSGEMQLLPVFSLNLKTFLTFL